MRFGGLTAVGDLSFEARRGDITALIGPNGAGKTTVFNCITGFYKPTEGGHHLSSIRMAQAFLLERMDDFRITQHARVARTFQNIRLFAGMTVLENLMVAQHNTLMRASGYTRRRHLRHRAAIRSANKEAVEFRRLLAGEDRPHRPRRRSRRRPALWRPAPPGDRPRHVHRAACCCASTNLPPASTRANPRS